MNNCGSLQQCSSVADGIFSMRGESYTYYVDMRINTQNIVRARHPISKHKVETEYSQKLYQFGEMVVVTSPQLVKIQRDYN